MKAGAEEGALPSSDIAGLTSRMAQGDESAYSTFYDQYFHRLLRYLLVLKRGDEEAAREALQLTLVRLVRHIKAFDSEEALWSWLTVLSRSAAVDESRKRSRYSALLDRFFQRHRLEADAACGTASDGLLELLERSLNRLEASERALLERKYFEREPVHDIAASTGSTDKAIESRLVRARKRLKELILKGLNDERSISR